MSNKRMYKLGGLYSRAKSGPSKRNSFQKEKYLKKSIMLILSSERLKHLGKYLHCSISISVLYVAAQYFINFDC